MKVSELFEAVQGEPGQKKKLQGGAYYRPKFTPSPTDASLGEIRGSVKDWMDAMKITPQDIEKAVARMKGTALFRNELPKAGLNYEERPAGEKNGTFVFKGSRKYKNGYTASVGYNVYANGHIRSVSKGTFGNGEYMGPLRSPKPRMKAGDPVGSLVMIYTAAMEEMLFKWNKAVAKLEKEAK